MTALCFIVSIVFINQAFLFSTTSAMSMKSELKQVLVTGGNKGIGRAICERLLSEWDDTYVILGSRSKKRGEEAIEELSSKLGLATCKDRVKVLVIDTSSSSSVENAAVEFASGFTNPPELYGIINNAGIMEAESEITFNTNYFGPRRVNDAFGKFLKRPGGRIVNVASASGPMFLQKLKDSDAVKIKLMKPWLLAGGVSEIDELARSLSSTPGIDSYGASKALLNAYTAVHSKLEPSLFINSCTPGFIKTDMTAAYGATNPPSKGAVPPCWLMMDMSIVPTLPGGRFYGSDCVRSSLHSYRGPGEEPYIDDSDLVELQESARAHIPKV